MVVIRQKRGEPVHEFPYLLVAGVENMRAVDMDMDTFLLLAKAVASKMISRFQNKDS
jgi:hypothetical protein